MIQSEIICFILYLPQIYYIFQETFLPVENNLLDPCKDAAMPAVRQRQKAVPAY